MRLILILLWLLVCSCGGSAGGFDADAGDGDGDGNGDGDGLPACQQDGDPCDDGIACTVDDRCRCGGVCRGRPDHGLCPGGACLPECSQAEDGCISVPEGVSPACLDGFTFQEVFCHLEPDRLLDLLADQGLLRPLTGSVREHLLNKGIDIDSLMLRPDGVLSAVGDYRLGGSLFVDQGDWTANLMAGRVAKEFLKEAFENDRASLLAYLSEEDLSALYYAEDRAATPEPLIAYSWTQLDDSYSPFVTNPVVIKYLAPYFHPDENTVVDDYLQGSWETPADQVAAALLSLPAGQRTILIASYSYATDAGFCGVDRKDLDPLRNENGDMVFVELDPGDPCTDRPFYHFPARDCFEQIMQQRLEPYLAEISALTGPDGMDAVILDYERYDSTLSKMRTEYRGHYDLLAHNQRLQPMLAEMGLEPADVLAMEDWGWGDERQMRWDRYTMSRRAESLYRGVFAAFETHFPGYVGSNWLQTLQTEQVLANKHHHPVRLWGLGTWVEGSLPNIALYGPPAKITTPTDPLIPSDPKTPNFRSEEINLSPTTYYTIHNSLIDGLNRIAKVLASTRMPVQHWVTLPQFPDNTMSVCGGIFGGNVHYDPALVHNPAPDQGDKIITGVYFSADGNPCTPIGNVMAEFWYMAAVQARAFDHYYESWYVDNPDALAFTHDTLTEVNEMLGYSDRTLLADGWIERNGVRTALGPGYHPWESNLLVWGARANGKKVYRVVLSRMTPEDNRMYYLVSDGSTDGDVVITWQSDTVRIPRAQIYHPASEVSLQGFWVIQDPAWCL